jgi:ribonuclease J
VAVAAGVPADQIFICDNGDAIFLEEPIRLVPSARPAGAVFLDAAGGAEIEGESIRERRLLGAEGLVVVLAVLGPDGPRKIDVVARGLSVPASALSREVSREIMDAFADSSREERLDPEWARATIQQTVRRLCRRRFSARPLIVPIVAEG